MLTKRQPWRFGSFAVLPMRFSDAARRKAEYALDVLGADGVVLLASTDGIFLIDIVLSALLAIENIRKSADLPLEESRRGSFSEPQSIIDGLRQDLDHPSRIIGSTDPSGSKTDALPSAAVIDPVARKWRQRL